jgi:hypothetical protein
MSFHLQKGRASYVKSRGNHHYYYRTIPVRFRYLFGRRAEWMIELEANTGTASRGDGLGSEAQ